MLTNREFWDIDQVRDLFTQFDESSYCSRLLSEFKQIEDEILCKFDDEAEPESSMNYASVFGEFQGQSLNGVIGVVGPKRMRYEVIIPNVRYFSHLLNTIINEQGL
jgi:heat-inducible transcriptional repressor